METRRLFEYLLPKTVWSTSVGRYTVYNISCIVN